ncbi:MAG: SGNH/GDSL hydrolase family protein [Armatimonadota bacterium]
MTLSCLFVISLIALALIQPKRTTAQNLKWREAVTLEVEGKGWTHTAAPFDRLPDSAKGKINGLAWDLSKNTAGICIRFITDAAVVNVKWSVTSANLDMPHMPATGVSGLDLYIRNAKGEWRFVGNGRPGGVDNEASFGLPEGAKLLHECLLYLPLYNGIKSLTIGVPADCRLDVPAPRPVRQRKPVVVYGTSIAQGGCASRPGMLCSSIVGRWLDRPMVNLGFSASGDMVPPVGEVLAEIDAAAFVIDCLWNMGDFEQKEFDRRVFGLVQAIRKTHLVTPIVFVGQSLITPEAHPTSMTRKQEASVHSLQKQGDKNLVLIPGDKLIGDDGEATVDGVHLTDLGMDRQAKVMLPVLKKLLR